MSFVVKRLQPGLLRSLALSLSCALIWGHSVCMCHGHLKSASCSVPWCGPVCCFLWWSKLCTFVVAGPHGGDRSSPGAHSIHRTLEVLYVITTVAALIAIRVEAGVSPCCSSSPLCSVSCGTYVETGHPVACLILTRSFSWESRLHQLGCWWLQVVIL